MARFRALYWDPINDTKMEIQHIHCNANWLLGNVSQLHHYLQDQMSCGIIDAGPYEHNLAYLKLKLVLFQAVWAQSADLETYDLEALAMQLPF